MIRIHLLSLSLSEERAFLFRLESVFVCWFFIFFTSCFHSKMKYKPFLLHCSAAVAVPFCLYRRTKCQSWKTTHGSTDGNQIQLTYFCLSEVCSSTGFVKFKFEFQLCNTECDIIEVFFWSCCWFSLFLRLNVHFEFCTQHLFN